ncbi:G2/mitotic-specific cyclin-B [Lucilia cuprina]|uniref:G2/mitotic-specific cyclin-B n=1 Tax=Lucilia cuprina TaxID=7375 RepID=A0A0L0CKQ2_LUCCU|nr:G2/mitotic-specific cyclin-B [Lucilia cuprina]KNC32845.1 G2/mitotic-specific cyclin-B [Lucilia cuprina]
MVGTTVLKRVDENESAAFKQVKKIGGLTTTEVTKRAALGDLQNRGVVRTIAAKDAAQKDLKDTRLQNALRGTKARVDTQWKKTTTTTTTTNPTVAGTKTNLTNGEVQKTTATTAATAGQRKILTRSNSVRLGTSTATTGLGLQRHASSHLLVGQNRVKTLTTKVIENKVQQVKVKADVVDENKLEGGTTTTLRREDSNLSRKSLTKIQAAITQKAAAVTTKPTLVKSNSTGGSLAIKKDLPQIEKKEDKLKIVSIQSHSSKLLDDVKDIDEGDGENLILVSEYVNDIYAYLFKLEAEQPVHKNHLEGQAEVYAKMRAVLIDWINEVHTQFHLVAETFQLAVAIIDRYLQAVKDTKRSHLQLVGVTALFIAAKYEELFPPAIADFIYITDDTYTGKQIRQMELQIFKALGCNLSRPLPIHFLRRFSKAADAEDNHHAMSKYFLELAMIEYDMSHYKPSEIAAASLFLSLNLLKENSNMSSGLSNKHWNSTLEWYSRYSPEHLRPIAKKIASVARNAPHAKLKAVYTKYQASKFQKVSMRSELYSPLMDSIISSK